MKRSMIIQNDNGIKTFHACQSCKIEYKNGSDSFKEDMIKIFYSIRHAIDSGWTYISCRPDESGVWICPECLKNTHKKYWYMTVREMCPVCGKEREYKYRSYDEKLKDPNDRIQYSYINHYCYT